MSKGISPVIASIILILIVLSLVGGYNTFIGRVTSSQAETGQQQSQELGRSATTLFHIEGVHGQNVVVVNDGLQKIKNNTFVVTIDGNLMNYTSLTDLEPSARGELFVRGLWRIGPGGRIIKVSVSTNSDSLPVTIEPNDGLALDLRFDEGSGSTVYDGSGNGHRGTLDNGNSTQVPEWINGKIGNALEFDGDDYISLEGTDSLKLANFGIAAWFKSSGSPEAQLIYRWRLYGFMLGAPAHLGILGRCEIFFYDSAATEYRATSPASCTDGQWHFVVGSYDGTKLNLYLDGDLVASNATTATVHYPTTGYAAIGRDADYLHEYFNGAIDEVMIYGRAITPDQLYVMKRR